MDAGALLRDTAERAIAHLEGLDDRPVHATATIEQLRASFGGPLPDGPLDPATVVAELADAAAAGSWGRCRPATSAS